MKKGVLKNSEIIYRKISERAALLKKDSDTGAFLQNFEKAFFTENLRASAFEMRPVEIITILMLKIRATLTHSRQMFPII